MHYGLTIRPDLIIAGGDVVTMNDTREVLLGGSVVVVDGIIAAVGSTTELRAIYPDANVIDATDCVVTPGMVNAHQHLTGDPLVRSCIPDLLAPGASIFEWAVPIHAQHTADDDELSASLCAIECAQNGVTTVVEAGTVAHPDRVAKAMQAVGIRGTVGTWGWDIEEGPFVGTATEVLDRQRAVVEAFPLQAEQIVKKYGLNSDEFNRMLDEAKANPLFRFRVEKYMKDTDGSSGSSGS